MRRWTLAIPSFLLLCLPPLLTGQQPPLSQQLASAVLPLPEALREEATVLGYRDGQPLVELRRGTNGIVCEADDPDDDRFRSLCYAESLRPLLERRRELRRLGLEASDVTARLNAEAKAGDLDLPDGPAALYVLSGPADGYDAGTNALSDEVERLYILVTPYATAEAVGLSKERRDGAPWMMNSGQLFSHIMILPDVGAGEDR
ncbi:MAG: hypothetical protein ACE5HP_01025 [Gemmatimonadota bacterium]